jgi:hypothetical protein
LLSNEVAINTNGEGGTASTAEPSLSDFHNLNQVIADPATPGALRRQPEMRSKVPRALQRKGLASNRKLGPARPIVPAEPCWFAVYVEMHVHR